MDMERSTPSRQAIATRKYEAKVGLVAKSYKLKKELVDEFAETCKAIGVSQSAQLTKMMQDFIEEHK